MSVSSLATASTEFLELMVADAMDRYEPRLSQIAMTEACARFIENGGLLMAEAGTGTGKTFAYLIPIIISGKKAVVSTRTINLQEQLAHKDLKFLSSLTEFDYAVAKGRSNYLCLRRLNAFRAETDEEEQDYRAVLQWSSETSTGDVEDFGKIRFSTWDRIASDPDACKWKKCRHYGQCFYFSARRSWASAQIIIANHSLVGVNAMLPDDLKLFPETEILVVDEGHSLDHAVTDQIGLNISNRVFDYILNKLLKVSDKGTYKGLLSQSPNLFPAVESLRSDAELLWILLRRAHVDGEIIKGTFELKEPLIKLADAILELVESMRDTTTGLFEEDDELELKASMLKLKALAASIEQFPEEVPHTVRWIEIGEKRTALRMSPIYPRDFITQNILPMHESVIVTSATLSVSGDFRFYEYILGLEPAEKVMFPSPFNIEQQVEVDIKFGIDLRNDPGSLIKLAAAIADEAARKEGGMLVLFTSKDVMRKTWDLTASELQSLGLNPMMQGEHVQKRTMLEIMRESSNAVIFGLDSFWEGVDISGDALRSLIITKLPFEVPTEPITYARTRNIEQKGGNPFYEYSLPRAIIKFRQGFGRLIRSKSDIGRVVICDERIETKRYGKKFLQSIYC
ncbi:MAG TPA: helicase C-terminal domain-containing protein [Dissulfurispiraceae bacterium]|nr:helicase C-terminal domain-containing protein [Dissulfurispiraceae bacterium]